MAFLTPGGEDVGNPIELPGEGAPPSPGYPGFGPPGQGGFTGGFVPLSGQSSPFSGLQTGTFGGMLQRIQRRPFPGRAGAPISPMAQAGNQPPPMSMDPMGQRYGFGGSTTQMPPLPWDWGRPGPGAPGAPPPPGDGGPPPYRGPEGPDNPDWWRGDLGSGLNILAALIARAGGQGAFGLNPPEAIMNQVRQRSVADAGAQQRAARLGLQSRGDVDPSTYGFQALQSQLGGQAQTANAMSNADLALRQQQLGFLQALLGQYAGANTQFHVAQLNRPPDPGFDWSSLIPGIGINVGKK